MSGTTGVLVVGMGPAVTTILLLQAAAMADQMTGTLQALPPQAPTLQSPGPLLQGVFTVRT
jgi:hypothetical protein